jgi:asparagine synthase (glutamine-hydrolysing)
MCGIAGVSMRVGTPPEALMEGLGARLAHRGPDGEGFLRHRRTALVHRRLSILDLEGGAQPIATQDGTAHIVANGEIYNYRALQAQIREWGDRLRTDSDSEVPLHLWRRHGMDFVRHLEGMYALAIYDEATEDLILARDPVGIKPLYIAETAAGLAFSSEAGPLVAAGWIRADVEERAWPSYFNKQYVDGPLTMFKGVVRVQPGEVLRVRGGEIVERRVHPVELEPPQPLEEGEALAMLDRLGSETVRTHLQSDVPYGAFLSGGTDSTFVVTKMADLAGQVRTYAIGFSDASVADERNNAERLARKLGTDHHAIEFTLEDFWLQMPRMSLAMDDLVADYAALPTLKLAELASRDVKVILSGEGGDEGLAGYRRYLMHDRSLFRTLVKGRPFRKRGNASGFEPLFREGGVSAWRDGPRQDRFDTRGFTRLQTYQARDLSDWLPDNLMTKVDRCLMTHGIEGRVPLLDRDLLRFFFRLPDRLKISNRRQKYLLRRWVAERQPQQEPWAKKKGFTVPIAPWLEARRPAILSYLGAHPGVDEVIRLERLKNWLQVPLDGRGAKLLFNILCYASWHDIHVRNVQLPAALFEPATATAGT